MMRITHPRAVFRLAAAFVLAACLSACGDTAGSSSSGSGIISRVAAAEAPTADSGSANSSATAEDAAAEQTDPIEFTAETYSAPQLDGSVTLSVARAGAGTSAASVDYTTADDTAVAGTDYEPVRGTLEWAENDTTPKTISVPISNAAAFSGDKTFSVLLVDPSATAAIGSPGSARVNIVGGATSAGSQVEAAAMVHATVKAAASASAAVGTFQFAAASYAVSQGTTTLVLPVRRTGGTHGAASVYLQTIQQTAIFGVDYARQQTQLKWVDGDASTKSITINFLKTNAFTGTRTFKVALNTPSSGAKVGSPGVASVTIDGSGAAAVGRVALSAASYSINQNQGSLKVSVNRVGGSRGNISVAYAETAKTAIAGRDFTAATGTLRWADGDASAKVLTIGISNATPFSGTRSFTIALSSATGGAALSSPSSAIATIKGSATAAVGSVQFSAATYNVAQNAGQGIISVHRTGGSAGAISVSYAASSGGAIAGTDFTATRGTLNWGDGDVASKTISIPVSNARPFSGTKSLSVALSAPTAGATLGTPSVATMNITGSGAAAAVGTLKLSNSNYSADQQDGTLNFSVNRTGGSAGVVSVKYATTNGTAIAGKDYTAATGSIQWAAGDVATKQISIRVSNAALFSGSKEFTIGLSGVTGGATLGSPSTATATIDGAAPVAVGSLAIASAAYGVAQNAGQLQVTVNRTGGFGGAVSVHYSTSNGTALAGSDYTASSGTLNWADGDGAAKTFPITISNATAFSGTKSFTVSLSNAGGGASLGNPTSAAVTINGSGTSSGGSSGSTFWVYHDGAFHWTADFSFLASINYKDTNTAPLSGPSVIGVTITGAFGGFQPYSLNGFDTSPYKYLIFSIKPTVPNQVIGTGFDANNDVKDGEPLTIAGPGITKYGPVPVVGQWNSYKIPLADFGFNNPNVLKFSIADGTGNPTNLFYVDNAGFSTQ